MPKWIKSIAKTLPGKFLTKTIERYFLHGVAQEAAALAYYLLFMIFPLLIFLSSLLGLLELDISGITNSLDALLPSGRGGELPQLCQPDLQPDHAVVRPGLYRLFPHAGGGLPDDRRAAGLPPAPA